MFFFKQKTAYDMRISDWSSDVFSSDLVDLGLGIGAGYDRAKAHGIGTRNVEHEEARRALRHGRPDFGGDARLDRRKRDEQGEAKTERDDERAGARRSAGWGKSVSVRVDLGGRRIVQNNTHVAMNNR